MQRLDTQQDLAVAVDRLVSVEPRFAPLVWRHGLPSLRHAPANLQTLLRIVTDQLVSLRAGEAIWARLAARLGGFAPQEILALTEEELRSLGLSRAKARTFHAAARRFADDAVTESSCNEEETVRRLTGIPGVGPWTANIYLLMAVRSADAWPAADLALQLAARDVFVLPMRPSARDMGLLAEPWRPCRTAAALLLWSHYRAMKGMSAG